MDLGDKLGDFERGSCDRCVSVSGQKDSADGKERHGCERGGCGRCVSVSCS